MSEEEKNRSEEIEDFKYNLEQVNEDTKKIKELAQSNIKDNRTICVNMDRVEDSVKKQKEIAKTLTKDVVQQIQEADWEHMKIQFGQAASTQKSVSSLRRDMESAKTAIGTYASIAYSFASSNTASGWIGHQILGTYANMHPPLKKVLEQVEFTPTWIEDIEVIRQELPKIFPGVLKEFESVIADMSGTGDPDLKHKALLSLRSVIFYQLFDALAPESSYCKTPWYTLTPPSATPFRKKRFCQAKCFVIGARDESQFPQSMTDTINKTAMELQSRFDDMSNYGKKGGSSTFVDGCYKETLASFANALRLKSEVQKSYP